MKNLQLTMRIHTPQQITKAWAFAAAKPGGKYKQTRRNKQVDWRRSSLASGRCTITAVSREARLVGVRVGMALEDAKQILPELKVLIYSRQTKQGSPQR